MRALDPARRLGAGAAAVGAAAALLLLASSATAVRRDPPRRVAAAAPPGSGPGDGPGVAALWQPPPPSDEAGVRGDPWAEDGGDRAVPPADRATRKALRVALRSSGLPARLAGCLDALGGFGGGAHAGPVPAPRPAALALEVEAVAGAFRIAEVRVHRWGEASQPSVACAAERLRGTVVRSPAARAGLRARLILTLTRGPTFGRPAAGVAAPE